MYLIKKIFLSLREFEGDLSGENVFFKPLSINPMDAIKKGSIRA